MTLTAPVRTAVIGVGLMGERHARVLRSLPEVSLVGVYDPDAARARQIAERYGTISAPSSVTAWVALGGM